MLLSQDDFSEKQEARRKQAPKPVKIPSDTLLVENLPYAHKRDFSPQKETVGSCFLSRVLMQEH